MKLNIIFAAILIWIMRVGNIFLQYSSYLIKATFSINIVLFSLIKPTSLKFVLFRSKISKILRSKICYNFQLNSQIEFRIQRNSLTEMND